MSSTACVGTILAAVLASTMPTLAQDAPDPAAAERQYRLAQRLGADGSPDAGAAFERVVALDPRGRLADDALADLARLLGAPDWPEDLGALDAARAAQARAPLEKLVDSYREGDRLLEARYRLALIRMAPIAGRDAARARQDLLALASSPSRERWVAAGRYALGILDELSGAPERAAGAFARILVEQPDSDVAPRASAGFGRTLMARERFGEAAGWFQESIEGGATQDVHAQELRELALREVLRARVPSRRWGAGELKPKAIPTTRGSALLATAADGRMVIFDRRIDALQMFDATGASGGPAPVSDVTALATDRYGRVFMATKDKLLRLDNSGPTIVSTLASFGSPAAIAADASGSIWIADRKGERIARWTPGSDGPVLVRESKGSGVAALVVSGSRVIAAEEKSGRLVAITESGAETPFGTVAFRRPIALAVDGAGRISVLDAKAETLTRLSPLGEVRDALALGAIGVTRPVAIAAAPDGAVRVLDGASGAVVVAP